ncbi:DUF6786 family protein [Sanyastnella coralliicola]|uniref:DUF6786 family protein n=1 Tax=Sanyastnella coralliicola TaxID=3069118 RepID=UPI0027BAAFD2|nr:DUF6786 family protein [Longitalea sp. SCSIO 12813]
MAEPNRYRNEIESLKAHCEIVELRRNDARLAVSPSLQGRVLTSAINDKLPGFGWINHELIASGEWQAHINAYGGEDRFWIGPEAGQFALFFEPGAPFEFEHWQTPACVDSEAFELVERFEDRLQLRKDCQFKNYQGQAFDIRIEREIVLHDQREIQEKLGIEALDHLEYVAFSSFNHIINRSSEAWSKESGLLNIWILGQFKTSPSCWAIVPKATGSQINTNYFEADLSKRLFDHGDHALFCLDGSMKAKIGLAPNHDRNILASYDSEAKCLTLTIYDTDKSSPFLCSEWNHQEAPYEGDVLNVYNDGPNPDGSVLGPYYELETSSSSRELKEGERISHQHSTYHFVGEETRLIELLHQLTGIRPELP